MSIILKGIDIPDKENRMYMMELYSDGHCSVAKIEDGKCYELTIPSETEAIQIPKGHGRLIDWDAFNNKLDIAYAEGRGKALAPTILEAEEYK